MARLHTSLSILALCAVSVRALRLLGARNASVTCGGMKVPAELHDKGVKLFGSEEKLEAFRAGLLTPRPAKLDTVEVQMTGECADVGGKGLGNIAILERESAGDHYNIKGLPDKDTGVIVDIGANIGDNSLMMAKIHPAAQIVAFEPVPPTYFTMVLNLWMNGVPLLTEADIGVKDKPGVLALNNVVGDGATSLNLTWSPRSSQSAQASDVVKRTDEVQFEHARIHSFNLVKFLTEHKALPIRMLKLDCEGCEYTVLPAVKELVEDTTAVDIVSGEVHAFAPSQAVADAAADILDKRSKKCASAADSMRKKLHNMDFAC